MPETRQQNSTRRWHIRHRGRTSQVSIYLRKFLRMFVYQSEWKVLPMAAVIAGLVAMVIRNMLFLSREGTTMGVLALVCVAIWNGCFNSIQVICRERDVVKREHRAGMHISSYIMAHLLYQALICLLQTGLTLYICRVVGVQFPAEGMFTPWLIVDMGITLFFISFASDVLALLVSSLAHSTTAAMTIMPFLLIFQLVFSGGMLSLPAWSAPLSDLTISRHGIVALSAQADYNSSPLASVWNTVIGMKDREISGTFTLGQAVELLQQKDNPTVRQLREIPVNTALTVGDLAAAGEEQGIPGLREALAPCLDQELVTSTTLGELADRLASDPNMAEVLEIAIPYQVTVSQIIDLLGWENVRRTLQDTMGEASLVPEYERSRSNIASCWVILLFYTGVYAALATIALEFIDKDKR